MKMTLLGVCVAIAVSCGLFFRFYHIDRKVFWEDEVYSAMRIAGDREEDVIKLASAANTAADLRAILHPGPLLRNASLANTVEGLIREEPQHPPIYFALAHLWSKGFGDSVRSLRLFSAVVGVLAIPAMFWLCFELFSSLRAGWIGAALIATSPVAVLYSQEIRDYCLWTVALLVVSASLLRALRLQTIRSWALYAATLAFCLYVYTLSILTAVGFAAFVALDGWKRRGKKPYALAGFVVALVVFSPWLIILVRGLEAVHRGTATLLEQRVAAAETIRIIFGSLRFNFFDYDLQTTRVNLLLSLPVLLLVGYALYFCCRTLPLRVWSFIVTLLFFATIPIAVHDLLFGGILVAQTRYFIPAYLACDLALVGLFDSALAGAARDPPALLWNAVFIVLLGGRLSTCAVASQAMTWWTKFDELSIPIAQTINASPNPLFLSDNVIGYVLSVAEYLRPNVAVNIHSPCHLCETNERGGIGSDFRRQLAESSDVYLLGPSQALQARVKTALRRSDGRARYWCIDVRGNCASDLRLWRWVH